MLQLNGSHLFIRYHCTSGDVSAAIARTLDERGIVEIAAVKPRSNNDIQFVCSRVERLLDLKHIVHELVHPLTPTEDANVDLFNSILEMEVIRGLAFSSFENARSTLERFLDFCNAYGLHSAIGYMTPREVYVKWKEKNREGGYCLKAILFHK